MKLTTKLHRWKQTKLGLLTAAVIELLLSYLLTSRAIDTGSWWQYLFALIFLVGGAQNLIQLAKAALRGNKPNKK